jgi:general secretion pathway protein G
MISGIRCPASPRRGRGGFTLLEILVVVMIITILATIVGVNVAKEPARARVAAAHTQIGVFKQALQVYRMDQGRFPTQEQGLKALCQRPQIPPVPERYPEEGYLDSRNLPKDPWGHDYVYLIPGAEGVPYEIISYGAGGEIGGEGEAADISSRDL